MCIVRHSSGREREDGEDFSCARPRGQRRNGVHGTESSSPSFVYAPRTHERNTQGARTPRRREARRRSHNYAHPLELHSFIKVSEHGKREREKERETYAAPC